MTTKPLTTVDRDGKPGRPPRVVNVARRVIATLLQDQLAAAGVLPSALPKSHIERTCQETAERLILALRSHADLHIVPGRIVRELALIVGEAAPPPPKDDTPQPAAPIH